MRITKKIDLSDWVLPNVFNEGKTFEDLLQTAIEEVLEIVFDDEDDKPYIYFPVEWNETDGYGGPKVSDPLTIYMVIESIKTVCSFNLRESLAGTLESCAEDGSHSEGLSKLSHALRDLANEIDAACAKHIKETKQ